MSDDRNDHQTPWSDFEAKWLRDDEFYSLGELAPNLKAILNLAPEAAAQDRGLLCFG
jgi:hypothetical protein